MTSIDTNLAGFSSERLTRVSRLLQGYVDRGDIAGIIARVGRRGQVAYHERFGWMDREAHKPMRDDAIFMIASMTKPVTAVAAMMLYEEGRFDLNTPIKKFIPAFADTKVFAGENDSGMILAALDRDITFRHLFTHSAGLSYGWNPDSPVDRAYRAVEKSMADAGIPRTNARVAEELAKLPLAFQPGTRWGYSMSIDLLGGLVEILSGQTLDVFCEARIFKPLGMPDTGFFLPPEKAERRAIVYGEMTAVRGRRRLDEMTPPAARPSYISGGGGLVSTVEDYSRFAGMLTDGGQVDGVRLLAPSTMALFSLNQLAPGVKLIGMDPRDPRHAGYGYSLGTRVLVDVAESGCAGNAGEFGWDGAFNTYFWIDPAEDLYGLLLMQHHPFGEYPIHREFKQTVYQALVG
ncbi:MAG: beta-lactamase family protein [Anaerolineae bacterium]|nr:beta-lactamase family protein [Anaerolineae bacterium]